MAALTTLAPALRGVEPEAARALFLKGQYAEGIRACEKAITEQESGEEWRVLLAEGLLAVGRYTNAFSVIQTNLEHFSYSLRLRWLGHSVYRQNGQREAADALLAEIRNLANFRSWAYQDAASLVAIGRTALMLDNDPKRVLEQIYDRAKKRDPSNREPYLASGQLALDKSDFDLAAKTFAQGVKKFPDDPEFHHGLARAYAPSDRRAMVGAIEETLGLNTNHVGSYLLLADHLIDGEDYDAAGKTLGEALAVNPWHPEAWAYRAVIAHLKNDSAGEARARAGALKFWSRNPQVDHLIGKKLSQKYRFAEGAAYQRRALVFDEKFLPARIQLSQDLLRLGQETEGWELATSVYDADGYDVNAFNLVNLQDKMEKFATLTNHDFIVRMGTNEAPLYGSNVLALLQEAKDTLCPKYGMVLTNPTIVEIFPEPKDFGVRTFGMPGNPGYLGVCFGSVITANSPASQAGHPANWQAVLWHEFCHVVTLQLTKNKMPRWLSEGISVYEEKQRNPSWGQDMNPRYREMILGKDFVPLGQLSAAFLAPKTDLHLQFAYYQSSLAVEFLAGRFGLEAIRSILRDLGGGMEINTAITNRTEPLVTLEKDFAKFARDRAEKLAPGLDFEKPKFSVVAQFDEAQAGAESRNYFTLTRQARQQIRDKKHAEARETLEKLLQHFPTDTSPDNASTLLAQVHRALGETNQERAVLSALAERDADAVDAYLRLMELSAAAQDWPAVATNAERYLAVNPLVPQPYRYLALASEKLGRTESAIHACRNLLRLDPPDPAGAHFQLAKLLHRQGDPAAKRQVLQALEEAPRFRDAQRLLLELNAPASAPAPKPGTTPPVKPADVPPAPATPGTNPPTPPKP